MSDTKIYLKPQKGVPVMRPDGTFWPEEGDFGDTSELFIRRRMDDGDLVEASPPRPVKPAPAPDTKS